MISFLISTDNIGLLNLDLLALITANFNQSTGAPLHGARHFAGI